MRCAISKQVERISREAPLPISFLENNRLTLEAQQRHLPFNICLGFAIDGRLNVMALEAALKVLVRRHEVLRTTFHMRKSGDGGRPSFERHIHPESPVRAILHDLRHVKQLDQDSAVEKIVRVADDTPFEYSTSPLIRAEIMRLAEDRTRVIFVVPHLTCDGLSIGILRREFLCGYSAASVGRKIVLPDLPVQFVDFVAWQREYFRKGVLTEEASYWLPYWARYGSFQITFDSLPFYCRDGPLSSADATRKTIAIDSSLSQQVRRCAARWRVTPYMLAMACFSLLIASYAGMPKIAFWSNFSNRVNTRTDNIIGWFSNSRLLYVDTESAPLFSGLVGQVRETVTRAITQQEVPGHLLAQLAYALKRGERDIVPGPQRHVSFDLVSLKDELPFLSADGCLFHSSELPPGSRFPAFAVTMTDYGAALDLSVLYPKHRCDGEGVAQFLYDLRYLLQRVPTTDCHLSELAPKRCLAL